MAIHQIMFVITILMALFCAVNTVKCYAEGSMKNQPLTEEECIGDEKGCMLGLECLDKKKETFTGVIRGCQPDPDFCNKEVSTNVKWNAVCKECSYCTGDLCNDKGLKKTGLKCYTNGLDGADNDSVAECLTGQVGCLSALKCGPYNETIRGCIWTKDACTIDMLGAGMDGNIYKNICESCTFCDTQLCNDQGMEVKSTLTEKSTTKTVKKPETTKKPESGEKPTPKTVEHPKEPKHNSHEKPKSTSMEKQKSKEKPPTKTDDSEKPESGQEGATDSPNGAGGIVGWGQIGIPFTMMALAFAAGLLKMLTI